MATSTMLSAKGMRQPQLRNAGPESSLQIRTTRLAIKSPAGTPNCGHDAAKPRCWFVRVHSIDISTDPRALDEAQRGEDHRAPDADALVGWHERHREGGEAHHHQRGDKRRLAADAVAVVTEDRGADRARDEAHRVDGEGLQRAGERVGLREEELREDEARDDAVEEEVVPLDGGADGAGDDGAAQLRAGVGLGLRELASCGEGGSHAVPQRDLTPEDEQAAFLNGRSSCAASKSRPGEG